MNAPRCCCRPGCPHFAVATLTFVYSDSTAVVGPLAIAREPHSWDLCVGHARRITAPRGWELVRHCGPLPAQPDDDDLVALAEAVREGHDRRVGGALVNVFSPRVGASVPPDPDDYCVGGAATVPNGGVPAPPTYHSGRRRGHLRVLPDPTD
ncbi:MAG: DUF3499 domain-containing protein [Mycobacteriaceae bacterium]|nr:DUF3499 domain-containing protein [Mycobacteriaceae bacterium]